MTDNQQQRFQTASDAGLKAYSAWVASPKDTAAREQLMEAVHELRKTLSRIEIEMALSERDENVQGSMTIPTHRAAQHRPAPDDEGAMPARSPRPPRDGNREGNRDGGNGEPRRRSSSVRQPRPASEE